MTDTRYYTFSFFVVAAWLGLVFADMPWRELWLDESHSALLASMSFSEMLRFVNGDVHPPLYFATIYLWESLFGNAPETLRALSLSFHLLSVLLIILLARRVFENNFWALTLVVLYVFSPVLYWYSIEVRMYSLMVLMAVASLLACDVFMERPKLLWSGLVLGVVLAMMFYSHYGAAFFVAGLYLFLLVWSLPKGIDSVKAVVLSGCVAAALCAPWGMIVLEQRAVKLSDEQTHQTSFEDPQALVYQQVPPERPSMQARLIETAMNMASIAGVYPADSKAVLGLLLLPFAFAGLFFMSALMRRDQYALLGCIVVATFLLGMLLILGLSARRYFIPLTPVLLLILVKGLERAGSWQKLVAGGCAVALMLCTIAGSVRIYNQQHASPKQDMVQILSQQANPGDTIVFLAAHGQIPVQYYLEQEGLEFNYEGFPGSIYEYWESQPFKGWGSLVIRSSDLNAYLNKLREEQTTSFWLVLFEDYHYDPKGALANTLQAQAKVFEQVYPLEQSQQDALYTLIRVEL